jgi:hypothetical protein
VNVAEEAITAWGCTGAVWLATELTIWHEACSMVGDLVGVVLADRDGIVVGSPACIALGELVGAAVGFAGHEAKIGPYLSVNLSSNTVMVFETDPVTRRRSLEKGESAAGTKVVASGSPILEFPVSVGMIAYE